MILQCSHIDKSFVGETVLSDISFHINEQEKAAIVGVNGSGKSTLIKIIMGQLSADSGDIILSKDTTVGYLAQNQEYASDRTILEEMQDAKPEVGILERKLASLSAQMNEASGKELEALIKQFDQAQHRFDQINGYAYQSELVGVLKGLGFENEDFDKKISSLSGGEKTRVALAKMLLTAPDLIILDEPTNHLDLNAIHWLEGYLAQYNGAVLIVAHDRYFLDKIVSKVIEIRQTKSRVYLGNYTEYTKKRQEILDSLQKQYLNQQAEIKHQEEVIAKLKQFNREKSIKRAESREKMLDKIERIDKPIEENTKMHLLFTPKIQSGNDVLTVKGLSKRFADHVLFENIDFEIKRGEHVAIIGDNGSGKTTILKMINDLLTPDSGTITLGTNVEIGYYDQEHHVLTMSNTIFDEISDAYPDLSNTRIRNVLAAFLFTGEDVFKKIQDLSGGERGRVSLAKLMLSSANFLILDEPTNHLDITSKEILENAIRNYTGTVLYVSHDRYFINQTATRIIELKDKELTNYIGNYDYYEAHRTYSENSQGNPFTPVSGNQEVKAVPAVSQAKLSWQESKAEAARKRKKANDLKKLEASIEELENKISEIDEQFLLPENATNVGLLNDLTKERNAAESELEKLYEDWEILSEEN